MLADHAEALRKHGIDYPLAIERFGGNDELYEKLVFRILDDSHCQALHQKLDEGDAQAAYAEAHKLKGIAGNLSCVALYAAAAKVSEALRNGDLADARADLPEVDTAYQEVMDVLHELA